MNNRCPECYPMPLAVRLKGDALLSAEQLESIRHHQGVISRNPPDFCRLGIIVLVF